MKFLMHIIKCLRFTQQHIVHDAGQSKKEVKYGRRRKHNVFVHYKSQHRCFSQYSFTYPEGESGSRAVEQKRGRAEEMVRGRHRRG
jgi:hypothetical protein